MLAVFLATYAGWAAIGSEHWQHTRVRRVSGQTLGLVQLVALAIVVTIAIVAPGTRSRAGSGGARRVRRVAATTGRPIGRACSNVH